MRLQHLALEVRDQQRAIDFYARFFRFDPATARRYPDGVVILHDPDGFALALAFAPTDAGERGSGFPHFGFEMDSRRGPWAPGTSGRRQRRARGAPRGLRGAPVDLTSPGRHVGS
jgi:catechol 2,3-dioxygenase-like lactoylglutathione lyase family enzyme